MPEFNMVQVERIPRLSFDPELTELENGKAKLCTKEKNEERLVDRCVQRIINTSH